MIQRDWTTMKGSKPTRVRDVSLETFKKLLSDKKIRGASLADVHGTHHFRPLFIHPNTKQVFVLVKEAENERL